jgi:hypothetical protein
MMAATVADLAQVERDLESTAGSLQQYFRVDDRDAERSLYLAVESLMRAVSALHHIVEQEQKYRIRLRDRIDQGEYER